MTERDELNRRVAVEVMGWKWLRLRTHYPPPRGYVWERVLVNPACVRKVTADGDWAEAKGDEPIDERFSDQPPPFAGDPQGRPTRATGDVESEIERRGLQKLYVRALWLTLWSRGYVTQWDFLRADAPTRCLAALAACKEKA